MTDSPHSATVRVQITTSRWGAALGGRPEAAATAVRELAGAYWYPSYVFFRASGSVPDLATAQVESLLSRLLTEPIAKGAGQTPPTFRETMLSMTQATLADDQLRPAELRVDGEWAETKFAREPDRDPVSLFHRRWALTVLEYTLSLLESEYLEEGRQKQFGEWQHFLGYSDGGEEAYAKAAEHLAISTGAVRTGVFELRKRYRQHLRAQIFDTVTTEAATEAEHTNLLTSL